ncbi:MAG: DUF6695 family protein [Flavobacteriales bacterium]
MTTRNDLIVALAWPATWCKQAGAWYDGMLRRTGINKRGYYRVGHAAVLVLKQDDPQAHYFDMGRYHAPVGTARVRNAITDHDLRIETAVRWNGARQPANLRAVLDEVAANPACHGNGPLHWAAVLGDASAALTKARAMQRKHFHDYGPFVLWGSNCSRFVRTVVLAARPAQMPRLLMSFPPSLTPTPLTNIHALRPFGPHGIADPLGLHDRVRQEPQCFHPIRS